MYDKRKGGFGSILCSGIPGLAGISDSAKRDENMSNTHDEVE
jgi:hypothetical protein